MRPFPGPKTATFALLLVLMIPTLAHAEVQVWSDPDQPVGEAWSLELWVPPNLGPVMGLIVFGDGRWNVAYSPALRTFAGHFGFGIAGTDENRPGAEQMVLRALNELAERTGRPELRHAPFLGVGNSNGGMLITKLHAAVPERFIALTPATGVTYQAELPAAALRTPMIIGLGEWDHPFLNEQARRYFVTHRRAGARWALVYDEQTGHYGPERRLYDLFLPFWAECIRLRYPRGVTPEEGPVELLDLAEDTGWLADPTSWTQPLGEVYAYTDYPDAVREASWLPSLELAWLYRAAATRGKPLDIDVDRPGYDTPTDYEFQSHRSAAKVFAPGETIALEVETHFGGFERIEVYQGARRIREGGWALGRARETEFPLQLDPGVYAFSAVGARRGSFTWFTSPPIRTLVSGGPGTVWPDAPAAAPPRFVRQPVSGDVPAGEAATLAAWVHGSNPLRYQWRFQGEDLPGATSNILRLDNLTNAQAGAYTLVASNPHGESVSAVATLTTTEFQGLSAPATSTPPRIDGAVDEAWARAPVYPVDLVERGSFAGRDEGAEFRVLWDRFQLYVLVEVRDPTASEPEGEWWINDTVEVLVEGSNRKGPCYTDTDNQYVVVRGGAPLAVHRSLGRDRVSVASAEVEGGYRVELAIPFLTLGRAPRGGDFLGWSVMVNFRGVGKKLHHRAGPEAWCAPVHLGTLRLAE